MEILYLLTLGFLAAHELDAVACHEWRLLWVLRRMDNRRARAGFIALHVRLGVAAFAVIHAGLHYRLRRNPLYEFHSALSRTLIIAAALSGGAYGLFFLTHASAF